MDEEGSVFTNHSKSFTTAEINCNFSLAKNTLQMQDKETV